MWDANEYTITYVTKGGTEVEVQEVTYDEAYELGETTRTGYTFVEWQHEGRKFESGTWNITKDITLEAVWDANKYIITFDTNGGNDLEVQEVTYDTDYTLPVPKQIGYRFVGWLFNYDEFAMSGTWDKTYDINLTAKWEFEDFDGLVDENILTEEVKSNMIRFEHFSGNCLVDIYGIRNDNGVYFYIDYQSKENLSSNNYWYDCNHLEFNFSDGTSLLTNKYVVNTSAPKQFYISNGKSQCNFTSNNYVSETRYNEITDMYEITFIFYLSFDEHDIDKNVDIEFNVGILYKYEWDTYNDGWDGNNTVKVTNEGLMLYFPEEYCGGNHNYNRTKVIVKATCTAQGLLAKYCKKCNNIEYEEIETIDHNFETHEYIDIMTTSTCMINGEGTVECVHGCGLVANVQLPLDFTNHSNWDNDLEYCLDCHSSFNEIKTVDRYNEQTGWSSADWTYLANDLSGDFVVTTTFAMETNDFENNRWRGVMPIIQESIDFDYGRGSTWCNRFDWYGWCDQWSSGNKLTMEWEYNSVNHTLYYNRDEMWTNSDGENATLSQITDAMTSSLVVWKCIRTGTIVRNEFTIYSHTGEVFTYWSQATDINEDKNLSLVLTSEFARYKVLNVAINCDDADYNHCYGNYETIIGSCLYDSLDIRWCKYCNNVDYLFTESHKFNYDDVNVILPSTCQENGEGYVECEYGCGLTYDIILPLDLTNHTAMEHLNCRDCGLNVQAGETVDNYTGSWTDETIWSTLASGLEGDFILTTTYHIETNVDLDKNQYWEAVLPIIRETLDNNLGSIWVTRYDWYGWCDLYQSEKKLIDINDVEYDEYWSDSNGNDITYEEIDSIVRNCEVEWRCIRKETKLINEFIFTAPDGHVYTYYFKVDNLDVNIPLDVILASDRARYTIHNVTLNRGEAYHKHAYYGEIVTITPSTCSTLGEGYVCCAICDSTQTVDLDLDFTNHSNWDENLGYCLDCHLAFDEVVYVNRYNAGGWGAQSNNTYDTTNWTYIGKDLIGDFVITTTYTMEVNGITSNSWKGVLTIIQENINNGSPWVSRYDWHGWCDIGQSVEKLTQDWNNYETELNKDYYWTTTSGTDATMKQFESAMTSCEVVWKCIRLGTTVRNEFTIYSQTGEIFTYWTQATDINVYKSLNVIVISEFARYTIESVSIER